MLIKGLAILSFEAGRNEKLTLHAGAKRLLVASIKVHGKAKIFFSLLLLLIIYNVRVIPC